MPPPCGNCCVCWACQRARTDAPEEDLYKTLHLADSELSEEALIQALVEHPKLMERPIVVANGQARIGRPPEQVLDILG